MSLRGKSPERETKLIAAIRAAGSIRTNELSQATGVSASNIGTALSQPIARGAVYVCKVAPGPGGTGRPTNEYRIGGGMPAPDFKPLDTRRSGIARNTAPIRPACTAPLVAVSRPAEKREPEVPVFLSRSTIPQAQVGSNSASRQEGIPLDTPPAVSAVTNPGSSPDSTPKLATEAALNEEPTARPASAGAVLRMSIDQDGALQLGDEDDPARWVFTPAQVLALGDFLHGTQGVWRP